MEFKLQLHFFPHKIYQQVDIMILSSIMHFFKNNTQYKTNFIKLEITFLAQLSNAIDKQQL